MNHSRRPRTPRDPAVRDAARQLYAMGESLGAIARKLGVPPTTVQSWARRDGWWRDWEAMPARARARLRKAQAQTEKASSAPAGRRAARPKLSFFDRFERDERVRQRVHEFFSTISTNGPDQRAQFKAWLASVDDDEAEMIRFEAWRWSDRDERGEPQPPVDRDGYAAWVMDQSQRRIDESAPLEATAVRGGWGRRQRADLAASLADGAEFIRAVVIRKADRRAADGDDDGDGSGGG